MKVLNSKLELAYPDLIKWAIHTYGIQNGEDYVHDAIVTILEEYNNQVTRKMQSTAFLGLCRILITRAYGEARHSLLSRRSPVIPFDELSHEDLLMPVNRSKEARKLVRHILPHVPFAGRKVMYRLYVLGETERQCATALGLSFQRVGQIKQKTIVFLGKLVKQSNGGI